MNGELIKVNFKEGNEIATLEISRKVLSKMNVNEENPYIILSCVDNSFCMRRGVKNEDRVYKKLHKLIDKYYKNNILNKEEVYQVFVYLKKLNFIEKEHTLMSNNIEKFGNLIIETSSGRIELEANYDINLNVE